MHRAARLALLVVLPAAVLVTACGDKDPGVYDLETWRSPLASGYDGEGDAVKGEELYYNEHWEDSSAYALTCDSCHSADADDSWTTDADDRNRPAHTTWNAALREVWKGNHTWDKEDSDKIGAFGGQICVKAYFPSGSEMTPEQAAHLEAWMKTNIDDGDPSETADPLDYGFNTWDTQDSFVASLGEGLYGSDLGDVANGEALVDRYCSSCHVPDGETSPVFYSASALEPVQLVARIRRVDLGEGTPNDRMPRIPWDRLSDDDLADVLAFLTADREG
ncbi:MAG: cytochrome c [Alphaproteobacteria bacterium]|nr:cytochrome c [Alphaproteobacteria bacterium]